MDIYLIKTDKGSYLPAYDTDKEASDKIKSGEMIKAKISRPRNGKFHRKYFALISMVYANLPEHLADKIRSVDELRTEIKMQVGYREKRVSLSGKEYYVPKSIDYASMDNDKFAEFYNQTLDLVCKYILTGNTPEEVEREILGFL